MLMVLLKVFEQHAEYITSITHTHRLLPDQIEYIWVIALLIHVFISNG